MGLCDISGFDVTVGFMSDSSPDADLDKVGELQRAVEKLSNSIVAAAPDEAYSLTEVIMDVADGLTGMAAAVNRLTDTVAAVEKLLASLVDDETEG